MVVNMGRTRLHDEATGAALLDAAEKIAETEGLQALTVRRVAEKTGTTTRAVYTSLGSKQALLSGLGVRAFDILGAMVERLPLTSDPAADLVAVGTLGFRPFALNHPALFQIGIQKTSVPSDVAQAIAPAAERALPALHRRIARLQDAGRLGARTIPEAAWEFHAACEGLAALELRCTLRPEHGQRLWKDTLSALVAGWRHVTPGATPTVPETPASPAIRTKTRSGEAGNDLRLEY
jgi:AcrR family transcriptional regulator